MDWDGMLGGIGTVEARAAGAAPHDLLATKPNADHAEAAGLLQAQWRVTGSLRELAGERDRNYMVSSDGVPRHVLKIYNQTDRPEQRDFQHRLMALSQQQSEVPVPQALPTIAGAEEAQVVLDGVRHAAVLMTCLPGIPPATVSNTGFRYAIGRAAGALASVLGDFDHARARRELLWNHMCLPQLASLTELIEDQGRRAWVSDHIRRFEDEIAPRAADVPHQVIHNDLNPSNILVDAQRPHVVTGIIDFGDAVWAPRINEIAVSASYFLQPGAGIVDSLCAIVEGYEAFVRLTDDEIALLPDMIRTRLATRILLTHWRCAHLPHDRAYIMRNVANAWTVIDVVTEISPATISRQIQQRRRT